MQDFPQFELPGPHANEVDILQEILSVASASQQLMNQDAILSETDYDHSLQFAPAEFNQSRVKNQMGREVLSSRLVEISQLEEEFKGAKVVENLRGVKMSHEGIEEEDTEEGNTVQIESISNFQKREEPTTDKGVINPNDDLKHLHSNDTDNNEPNDFPLEFINEDGDDTDDSPASTPKLGLYEKKIEFSRGLFVSSRNAAQTFFHRVEPLETVRVYVDAVGMHGFVEVKTSAGHRHCRGGSVLSKFKAFIRDKLAGFKMVSKTTADSTVGAVAVLLTPFVYLGEVLVDDV
ncbi:hypothetical protein ACLOJK_017282 [Asimina triloba]